MSETGSVSRSAKSTVSMLTLTSMVVGSMVGAGVFSLPQRFAQESGAAGALTAWAIAGAGMLMLAFVFQRLAVRKPELDAGIYAYAKAGFGEYTGFFAAAGYWASACTGNVVYWVLIMSTLGQWFPALGAGDTILAIGLSSAGLWLVFVLVRRGVQEAAAINKIVTIAKVIPIIAFVLLAIFYFDVDAFRSNWGGADYAGSLFEQVRGTLLITVFVFLGVEGASAYSRYARKREDVGRATVLGFLSVLSIFASVTIISYGILPMEEIAELRQPSMAGVLEAAVGPWGSIFISISLIVAVLGAYLAWTLMAAEVLFVSAKNGDMPRFLTKESDTAAPVNALLMSTGLVQTVLILTYFSEDAFDFALDMTAIMVLFPFFLSALYAFQLRWTKETYEKASTSTLRKDLVITAAAAFYTAFLLLAAGLSLVIISFLFYAPVTILFAMTRKEQGRAVFSRREAALFSGVVILAILALIGLATGMIAI